ncbi:MAG: cobalamin biosynthesis protein CbiD [Lachnospiraceae bacterium]|nr:cobalamin biosynthesis protein CbiD [Candidatus Merdinaster equi]
MRYGFTTGSCSAAAAKAAVYMLLTGNRKEKVIITTPKGIDFHAEIVDIVIDENCACCSVIKDGGDDPDVTTGSYISVKAEVICDGGNRILIEGGEGVGRVTKPGLDQPIGNAAINSVPRQMIEKEVREVMNILDCKDTITITVSVPGGEELAQKTFNPRLGIVGGISILGTSGIVEPMSSQALLDTIRVELNQKRELGNEIIAITPGNYGLDFMKKKFGYNLDEAVKCSNYIGDSLEMIAEFGFKKVVLCGHIGKLIKVAGGIMNTHSREADCRIELMMYSAFMAGADKDVLARISECISTDAAYEYILKAGLEKKFMENVMGKIGFYLNKKVGGRFQIECIVYSNEFGLLGETKGARKLIEGLVTGD